MNDHSVIRKANTNDYEQIEKIMQQVNSMHVEWRSDVYRNINPLMPQDYFLELVNNGQILVYDENDTIIGIAIFMEIVASGGPKVTKKIMNVDSIGVLNGYRNNGVGRCLMDDLKRIASEHGCDGIELQVNAMNENGLAFYKNYGFKEKSINLELHV